MKKLLSGLLFGMVLGGIFPSAAGAESRSASFSVSVTIPERIQLAAPARLRGPESRPETLLLRSEGFHVGRETNLGKNIDAGVTSRLIGNRSVQVFTLTAI